MFFKLSWPRTGLAKILRARAQIVDNFRRNRCACGNLSLLAPYFHIYSSDVLVPVIGWRLRQLPGWPAPYSDPAIGKIPALRS
jgi:hypothetical protein